MPLDALERFYGAIDQQPLGCPADAQRRRVAQPFAGELLDAKRQLGIVGDIDVDRSHGAAHDADTRVGPAAPELEFEIGRGPSGMPGPSRIVAPLAVAMAAWLLGARLDREDGIAISHEAGAEPRHEAGRRTQNGTCSAMPSIRLRSCPASDRRWSQ